MLIVNYCDFGYSFLFNMIYTRTTLLTQVLAMALCLSQVGVLLKWLNKSGWFLAWELSFTYPTLCYKEIRVHPKIRVLPYWNLLQTGATTYRSSKRVINLA